MSDNMEIFYFQIMETSNLQIPGFEFHINKTFLFLFEVNHIFDNLRIMHHQVIRNMGIIWPQLTSLHVDFEKLSSHS